MNDANKIISVTLTYGGFFGGTERRTVTFNGENLAVEREFYNGATNMGEELFVDVTKSDFISEYKNIHTELWKSKYVNSDILDGTHWVLTTVYSDGEEEHFYGSNDFPSNFGSLLELMEMEK